MASLYPAAVDGAASLLVPVDATTAKPAETTLQVQCLDTDTTLQVVDAACGFAAAHGVISIDDEIIIYTGRTANTFTGCTRGAFGTARIGHAVGAHVRALMVAGFITRLQEAVMATQTTLGVEGDYNFAAAVHGHAASEITSGILAAERMPALAGDVTSNAGSAAVTVTALRGRGVADLAPSDGQVLKWNEANSRWEPGSGAAGSGTVTSVGLEMPAMFTVTGSPVTESGTITVALAMQPQKTFLAGPASGPDAAPAFRTLAASDLPSHTHAAGDLTSGIISSLRMPGLTGDVLSSSGSVACTVTRLQGRSVSNATPSSGQVLKWSGSTWAPADDAVGVTSVGLSMPDVFAVSGSPVTGSGTLAAALVSQAANQVFAGPASGENAAPSFRALVAADLPAHTHAATDIVAGILAAARMPGLAGDVTSTDGSVSTTVVALRGRALSSAIPAHGQVLKWNANTSVWEPANDEVSQGGGGGGVESVGLSLPTSVFTVTGSPVTSAGTLTGTFIEQNPNTVFAGPASGSAAAPSFRALAAADLGSGSADATRFLRGDLAWAAPEIPQPGDIIKAGAIASKPSNSKDGVLYLSNDSFYELRDTGTNWEYWGPVFKMTPPPALSNWSLLNQGAATIEDFRGGVRINIPASTAAGIRGFYKAAPARPYKITVAFYCIPGQSDGSHCCFGWRQSSNSALAVIRLRRANPVTLNSSKYTNETTFSAEYVSGGVNAQPFLGSAVLWLQFEEDNTKRYVRYSTDGLQFVELHSVTRTDFLTADQVMFGLDSNGAASGCYAVLLSWKEE